MRVPLTGGAYQAKSLIANAQRCLNLYPEPNAQDAPVPFTEYPRPGLRSLGTPPSGTYARCLYRASNGNLYYVIDSFVYSVSPLWAFTLLGSITAGPLTPVSMADNGIQVLIVDGTPNGFTIDLATNVFSTVVSAAFYGATTVQFVDTYFVLNKPGSAIMYISDSNATTFNPLNFAAKAGFPDPLVGVSVKHREVWLIGQLTAEVWYNTGASDFTFGPIPGAFIEHGCCAPYSIAKQDLSTYWLSQDLQGHLMVIEGVQYNGKRISTHAIENEIQSYPVFSDAIGFTYQIEGHTFYQLNFPTVDKTWVYDISTGLWHEQNWTDNNGLSHRHRANCAAFAYDTNICADWENGALYVFDPTVFTDNGQPIVYLRSFPHLLNDGDRVVHRQFIADMEVGTAAGTVPATEPMVSLRWSDTRGASWGNAITGPLGAAGEYQTQIQFQRLGMSRDRVYELSWSAPFKTALNGAFIDVTTAGT